MVLNESRNQKDYEIVVARYNEDLSWLYPYADHCHVYNKGPEIVNKEVIQFTKINVETRKSYISAPYHQLLSLSCQCYYIQGEVARMCIGEVNNSNCMSHKYLQRHHFFIYFTVCLLQHEIAQK